MSRDDDYDDRPRRRPRDDDDDYDDRPRRGKSSGGSGAGAAAGMSIVLIVVLVGVGLLFCGGIGIALLLPAVSKVREAAARAADQNNYKQVALGFHNHNDVAGRFPPADGDVSWRVHILPHVEQHALYTKFDPQQAWDSAKNRPNAEVRVPVYTSKTDPPEFVQTRMRVFTGPDTIFPPGEKPLNLGFGKDGVKDGLSATFLVVEANESVPWPQPRELSYARGGPLPKLGHPSRGNGFLVAMADGTVRFVRDSASEAALRASITATGGENVPDF